MGKDSGGYHGDVEYKTRIVKDVDSIKNATPEELLQNKAVRELFETLRFYTFAGQVKRLRGEVIEYDPDAGPLYNYYEVPYCDDGTKAREALEKFEVKK